jgi:hypothetical protein
MLPAKHEKAGTVADDEKRATSSARSRSLRDISQSTGGRAILEPAFLPAVRGAGGVRRLGALMCVSADLALSRKKR